MYQEVLAAFEFFAFAVPEIKLFILKTSFIFKKKQNSVKVLFFLFVTVYSNYYLNQVIGMYLVVSKILLLWPFL